MDLYKANWTLVGVIVFSAFVTFMFSFYRKLTTRLISIAVGLFFVLVVSLIYLIAFQRDLNVVLVVEAAVLTLFSKVVFQKLKHKLIFYVYIVILIISLVIIFSPQGANVNVLISTIILSILIAGSLGLADGSSVNNLSFANRILKNSELLVLVSDKSGKIVYVSNPLLELTGRDESSLLGLGWWEYRFLGNYDLNEVKQNLNTTLSKGSNKSYLNQINTPQGILDVEWSDYALEDKFVMSIGKNITEELKNRREIEMLSLVATSVTNGVSILNTDNKLIWHNDQFRQLFNLSDNSIAEMDIIKLLGLKDANSGEVIETISQIDSNTSHTVSYKSKSIDERFIMLTNSIVRNKDGSIRKRILVWTDVSEQYNIEKRYKQIINNAFDNIYTTSPKGYFTYVNKQMETILKLKSEEIIGKHFLDLIDDSCKAEAAHFYKKQFDSREPYSYYEFKIATKDGSDLWVGQNVRLILDDSTEERRIIELHAVARDITESKQIREELKRLSYVASKTGNVVIILSNDFKIEWVNEAFTAVFGYDFDEVIGRIPGEFLNGKNTDQETIHRIVKKLSNLEHVYEELINYDKQGNEKWIQISMDPIFDDNKNLVNYIAVESDITERKSQELLIKEQHQSIIDSLNYASIIQSATLPSKREINKINPNVAIYYNPKEIIGGDFYLVETVINNKGNIVEFYIVADCTGHGVPGAMLSVLCSSILKEAIRNPSVHNTADVLNFTRGQLTDTFRTSEEYDIYDGMELSMCAVDKFEHTIDYSGANRPLFIHRSDSDEIEVIRGDKQSVGQNYFMQEFTFSRHRYSDGDRMYLFTDGIIDQFGGTKSKKFMTSRFKNLLINSSTLPIDQQIGEVKNEFLAWQATNEQTDDVCLMGVQL